MADDRAAAGPFAVPEAADGPVWLRVGTLIDGISPTPVRDAHVVYAPRAIRFVGADGRLPPPDAIRPGQRAPDLDAPDATLLPGLIDAHTHFFLEGGELDPDLAMLLVADPDALRAVLADGLAQVPQQVRRGALHPYMLMTLDDLEDAGLSDFVEDFGLVFPRH